MPPEALSPNDRRKRFRFFVLTCRDARTDFRLPLVATLREHYETYYIWLRRRPIMAGPSNKDLPVEMSFLRFLAFLRRSEGQDDRVNVWFNSTNVAFPYITALLRLLANRSVWCLDMHDNLLYDYTGLMKWRAAIGVKVMQACSHVIVHAAPTLIELFPRSSHLGNASQIRPLVRAPGNGGDVLILASLDCRFDFDLLRQAAARCATIKFHVHGNVARGDAAVQARLESLCGKFPNIVYHGPYVMADLPRILAGYTVSFAPYQTHDHLTRYIDPLRYYHCLNSGMEVITTDIPQASQMKDYLHIVHNAEEFAKTLAAINGGQENKRDSYRPITWEQRAERLIEILYAAPKTQRLIH